MVVEPVTANGMEGPRRELLIGVDGVHCASCVERLRSTLAGRVDACDVDLATRVAVIRLHPAGLPAAELIAILKRGGFRPRRFESVKAQARPASPTRDRRIALARIGVAVFGAMQVMMFAWPAYVGSVPEPGLDALLRWAQLLVASPTVFWAGAPFFAGAARALRAGVLTMDVPVALSLAIAWAASAVRTVTGEGLLYFDTATMFVALLLIGRYLESATRARASERLRQLAEAEPATAMRLDGETVSLVPLDRLAPGDRVRVMPGDAVPADGVLETAAELDESLLTGESRAVARVAGDPVLAGSLNLAVQPLRLAVTAVGGQTRVAGMLRLLQLATLRKPQLQSLADRIAAHFTWLVLLLAAAGGLAAADRGFDAALAVTLSVLVVSCPCALSLAVPAVLAAATSRLAARGVLVARADRLLRLADVDIALLDKTGTLTESRPSIQRVVAVDMDPRKATRIMAALESGLAHPLARAFAGVGDGGIASQVQVQVGQGVRGVVDGAVYSAGAAEQDVAARDCDLSWVSLRDAAGHALAHFGLGLQARPGTRTVIDALRSSGIGAELLTGDSREAAQQAGRWAGIDPVRARQSPEDKLLRLRLLQGSGHVVLAVGDGFNDAAFLAAADVSVAMPAGAAVTQARADLVLTNERLDGLVLARAAARQARRRMHQNLAWALAYNLAMLPLALSGELQPWVAAAGMSLSSLLVVGNALRLRLPEKV